MAKQKSASKIDEKALSKGHLRKLTALRKSLGADIADAAFAQWLEQNPAASAAAGDPNAEMISDALMKLVTDKALQIPRGGYLIRRGRGRVLVERAAE